MKDVKEMFKKREGFIRKREKHIKTMVIKFLRVQNKPTPMKLIEQHLQRSKLGFDSDSSDGDIVFDFLYNNPNVIQSFSLRGRI